MSETVDTATPAPGSVGWLAEPVDGNGDAIHRVAVLEVGRNGDGEMVVTVAQEVGRRIIKVAGSTSYTGHNVPAYHCRRYTRDKLLIDDDGSRQPDLAAKLAAKICLSLGVDHVAGKRWSSEDFGLLDQALRLVKDASG